MRRNDVLPRAGNGTSRVSLTFLGPNAHSQSWKSIYNLSYSRFTYLKNPFKTGLACSLRSKRTYTLNNYTPITPLCTWSWWIKVYSGLAVSSSTLLIWHASFCHLLPWRLGGIGRFAVSMYLWAALWKSSLAIGWHSIKVHADDGDLAEPIAALSFKHVPIQWLQKDIER